MDQTSQTQDGFDFDSHKANAVTAYQRIRPSYEAFAAIIERVLRESFAHDEIRIASIQARAKSLDSFAEKAITPSESDSSQPKYSDPISQITDLAGCRIVTFFPRTIEQVDAVIKSQFDVKEKLDKTALIRQEERLGYQSVHYIVVLKGTRTALPEYSRFAGVMAEIQVRTILQHAWAEIEHDIQYKSAETIPMPIRRRFMALAGLLEIADREFESIQDEDEELRQAARTSVNEGRLNDVAITGDALKAYLDRRFGSDGRMKQDSYEFEAREINRLGFQDLQQVDECISSYDDDYLSRVLWGTRQGQLTRFEYMLLAGMGERYISRHGYSNYKWWAEHRRKLLERLRQNGVTIGNFDPAQKATDRAELARADIENPVRS